MAQSQSTSSEISGRAERAESRLAAAEKSLSEVEARLNASHETINSLEAEKVLPTRNFCFGHSRAQLPHR